jgi:RNA polymerase sigma-70 factor (ECF subfamily)
MHVQAPEAPEGENPRDTALLKKLRRARERGDESGEQIQIGELLVGWRGQVEAQQRFWGLSPADAEEVTGAWMERMTKVLMKKAEFDGPFGAVAMENAHWARRDSIRRKERRPAESLKEVPSRSSDRSDAVNDGFDIDNSPSEALGRALAYLSEREQRILDGFFGHDRAGATVAAELGMSPEAFRVAQHRAIGKIRKRLEAEGVTRSDLRGGNRT